MNLLLYDKQNNLVCFLFSIYIMKYFLWSFTLFIWIQTLRQNRGFSFLVSIFSLFLLWILYIFTKISRKVGIFVFLWFFFAGISIVFYTTKNTNALNNTKIAWEKYTNYIGSGRVVNFQWADSYLYEDSEWKRILKWKKEEIFLWANVRVVGKKREVFYEGKNISFFKKRGHDVDPPLLLRGEFDYNRWLYMKWYRGVIERANCILLNNKWNKHFSLWSIDIIWFIFHETVLKTRKWVFWKIDKNFWKNNIWWLLRGLLLGDRSGIPKKSYQTFIDSGLVHIIAVSGGNMVMLVLLLHVLLFFLPYYVRLVIILFGLLFYGLLCGLDSSVLRALLMWWLTMVALFSGRLVSVRRLMSYAWVIMLLLNPFVFLYDMGFLLSFGALVGIITFQKLTCSRGHDWRNFPQQVLQKYFLPTLWANLWVFPILIFFTGIMNITSLLGNMIVIPFVPVMMLFWLLSSLFGQYLSRLPLHIVEVWLLETVYLIASWSTSVGIYIQVMSMSVRFFILFIVLFFYRIVRKKIKQG